ncbi:MAG: hypothetical protein IKP40_12170 [Clostridia bacterium]|nr:hypothetical protein [Clostridia bacterium]
MSRLDQLHDIADESLAGLKATDDMRRNIRMKAAAAQPAPRRLMVQGLAFAAAALLCFLGVSAALRPRAGQNEPEPQISSYTLGQGDQGGERYTSDVGYGNVTIKSDRNGIPAMQNIWAQGEGGVAPLIASDGRYYRMLSEPQSAPQSVLGSSLGVISEFTRQPELSGGRGLLSNVVSAGTEVYQVRGLGGTLLAANVNGSLRVFQRVSYNNTALLSGEGLADTLQLSGHITGMALSGVGAVTDPSAAERLFRTLVDQAVFKSSGAVTASQTLLITLDNGLAVQLSVKGEHLGGCGVWSCPEFFDAFGAAVQP